MVIVTAACVFGGTRDAPASGRGLKGGEGLHSIQTRTAGQVDRVDLIHAEPGWITFRPGPLTVRPEFSDRYALWSIYYTVYFVPCEVHQCVLSVLWRSAH